MLAMNLSKLFLNMEFQSQEVHSSAVNKTSRPVTDS